MTKAEETTTTTHTAVQPVNDNGLPLVSMILGILSLAMFMLFLGIPAFILGIIGLKKYPLSNKAFSITGIVTGVISTLIMLGLLLLVVLGVFAALLNPDAWNETAPGHPLNEPEYRFDRMREGA